MRMGAVGRADPITPLLPAAQAILLHETGDAVPTDLFALALQLDGHARAAVGLPGLPVHARDLRPQFVIPPQARRNRNLRPRLVAAARNGEDRAKSFDGILVAHRLNPGMPLGDGSEDARGFFRISRCSVIRVSSRCKRSTSTGNSSFEAGGRNDPAARGAAPSRFHL